MIYLYFVFAIVKLLQVGEEGNDDSHNKGMEKENAQDDGTNGDNKEDERKETRKTGRFMTKYESARILATRAQQIR